MKITMVRQPLLSGAFAPVNLFMVVSFAAVGLFIYAGIRRNKKGGYQ